MVSDRYMQRENAAIASKPPELGVWGRGDRIKAPRIRGLGARRSHFNPKTGQLLHLQRDNPAIAS
ncbi:hypothetical protein [Lyngbya sp. CCY1209]|uniref:hypothetical protein n=1 Tax=Lyngbya sp. CCY1209 TaxID=2886103 RepID=UPI002D216A34|nr:hypothetical protein [Lyngbya sp. CCY1209]MEB3883044.1 hypothetical protein [Lyngbya sp. CCY1209]